MQHYFFEGQQKAIRATLKTKDLRAQMQQNGDFVASLEDLIEGFLKGRRGVRIGRVDISQRGIEGFVPHRLPDQECIRPLLDQEHSGGVLEDMGVL